MERIRPVHDDFVSAALPAAPKRPASMRPSDNWDSRFSLDTWYVYVYTHIYVYMYGYMRIYIYTYVAFQGLGFAFGWGVVGYFRFRGLWC